MRHFTKEIIKTREFSDNLPEILDSSPYKINHIVNELGIPRSTFYNKMKGKTFTINELEKIVSVIDPQEYNLVLLSESLERSLDDLKNNRILSHEDVMNRVRQRLK